MTISIILGVIVLLVIIIFGYILSTQRRLVSLDEMARNSLGQIGVQLASRWDALTNLVKMTEKYAKHEHDSLVEVIAQRRAAAPTANDINQQQGAFSEVLNRLMVLTENYPQLQAAPLFASTMASIQQYEEKVRMSRMVYNDSVTKINAMVRQWPSSFVAKAINITQREYLVTDDARSDYQKDIMSKMQAPTID